MNKIFCCCCEKEVEAELITGDVAYRGRHDLKNKKFWRCPTCHEFVGCHPNSEKPLGTIPTKKLKYARLKIHEILDPLWRQGKYSRGGIYSKISKFLGYQYHTGEINDIETARKVYRFILSIKRELQ